MQVIAAVLEKPFEKFVVKSINLNADLREGEVLVRVVATGLCHTDIAVRDQHIPLPTPIVLGHEGAGVVEKIGPGVVGIEVGDHVVLAPSSCGKCNQCASGHPSYCVDLMRLNFAGPRLDGSSPYTDEHGHKVCGFFFGQSSFGTYAISSLRNIVKVPNDIPLEMLGPLGCGLQTGAGTVLNVLSPTAGDSLIVFGVGPVGLAALMAAKAAGCTTIIAVDVHDSRLDFATSLGATHTINSRKEHVSKFVREKILKEGANFAIDTTGRSDVINQALASIKARGRCALVAVSSSAKLELDNSILLEGKTVDFVLEGDSIPSVFIPRLISLYRDGKFPFDKMITYYDLADINRAVQESESGVTIKAVLRMA